MKKGMIFVLVVISLLFFINTPVQAQICEGHGECCSQSCSCSVGGGCDPQHEEEGAACGVGSIGTCQCTATLCEFVACVSVEMCFSRACPPGKDLVDDSCGYETSTPPPNCGPIACGSATCDGCAGEDCCSVGCRTGGCPAAGSLTVTLKEPTDYSYYYRPRCYYPFFLAKVEWNDNTAPPPEGCDRLNIR
jgi:hypothetical protein